MIIYLTPQGKSFNPNRGITIDDTQHAPKVFLREDMRLLHGVTTKEVTAPDYDPLTQSPPKQNDAGEYSPPEELPLEQARENKRQAINVKRAELQLLGFDYDGLTFQCDEVSIARISATFNFAQVSPDYTQPFITAKNETVTLTNEQCKGLGYACAQFVAGLTFTARQLKDAVIVAKSNEELRAIQWPA